MKLDEWLVRVKIMEANTVILVENRTFPSITPTRAGAQRALSLAYIRGGGLRLCVHRESGIWHRQYPAQNCWSLCIRVSGQVTPTRSKQLLHSRMVVRLFDFALWWQIDLSSVRAEMCPRWRSIVHIWVVNRLKWGCHENSQWFMEMSSLKNNWWDIYMNVVWLWIGNNHTTNYP